jgi:hypothetical protein
MLHLFMRLAIGLLATLAIAIGACSLYNGAALFFAPVFGQFTGTVTPLSWVAAAIPVIVLSSLIALHAVLPIVGKSAYGRAFYIHALNGFYIGIYANRITDWLWRQPLLRDTYAAFRSQKSEV